MLEEGGFHLKAIFSRERSPITFAAAFDGRPQSLGKAFCHYRTMGSEEFAIVSRLALFLVLFVPDLWFPQFDLVPFRVHDPGEHAIFSTVGTV